VLHLLYLKLQIPWYHARIFICSNRPLGYFAIAPKDYLANVLHGLFWRNLAPAVKVGKETSSSLADVLKKEFGSFERFKKEFSAAAASTEGSGWASLAWCGMTSRPLIMQIEKHNVNIHHIFSYPHDPGCLGACLLSGL
jgi:hypothetical protein